MIADSTRMAMVPAATTVPTVGRVKPMNAGTASHPQLQANRPNARFASLLNWHGLELSHLVFSSDEIARWNFHASGILVTYMTPDLKFNLQINEHPIGQTVTYQATIKAERYTSCISDGTLLRSLRTTRS